MKKQLLIFTIALFSLTTNAQTYCDISTALAYTMDMPGITNFTLGTIGRVSLSVECGSVNCNNYVFAPETTDLEQGGSYIYTITHTRDAALFPDARNNIRIWIDYNNNGSFDDTSETVISLDAETFGITGGSFTVPSNATLGNTRMRVTIKMSEDAGRVLPTSCDIPADILGYHGEFEDYMVNITGITGTEERSMSNKVIVSPNPSTGIFSIQSETKISMIEIINVLGAQVYSETINEENIEIDLTGQPKGIYFYTLTNNANRIARGKIIVD